MPRVAKRAFLFAGTLLLFAVVWRLVGGALGAPAWAGALASAGVAVIIDVARGRRTGPPAARR